MTSSGKKMARSRAGRRRRVLFVTDFYVEELLAGIVDYARDAGWELHAGMRFHGVFPSDPESADGILATAARERVQDWLAERKNVPIVRMLGGYTREAACGYPAVEGDYHAAGRAAARHLLGLGHVRFGFFCSDEVSEMRELRDGFEAELAAVKRRVHRLDFSAANSGRNFSQTPRAEIGRWLARELKRLPGPIAVMNDDDRRALELLLACDLARLRVPDDVAILGCDNRPVEVGLARIPLSSVDMNFKGIGREAAALLDGLMQGREAPAAPVKVSPLGVVARRSTATFVTDSPAITAAVLHLREHFREPLRLAGLARRAGMSARVFESEFKRCVGRSARDEIHQARLACAARLLRDTDLKLEAIAVESGFGTAARLCTNFTRTHGVSPNVWRLRVRGV